MIQNVSGTGVQNDETFFGRSSYPAHGLLRPLKQLSKKLNHDVQQVEQLIEERKESSLKREVHRVLSVSDCKSLPPLVKKPSSRFSMKLNNTPNSPQMPRVNELVVEESEDSAGEGERKGGSIYVRMKTAGGDTSPNNGQ